MRREGIQLPSRRLCLSYHGEVKMKYILFVLLLLFPISQTLCQDKVFVLPYTWHGPPELDIADGGCSVTEVHFTSVKKNFFTRKYTIEGFLFEARDKSYIPDACWIIFLGEIKTVPCSLGTTWTLSKETGKIFASDTIRTFNNGHFKFKLPKGYKNKIIFTGWPSTVVELTLDSIVTLFNKEKNDTTK